MIDRTDRLVVAGLGAAVALFLAVAVASYVSLGGYSRSVEWVRHTHNVIGTTERLVGELRDAEIGQRGYLLTSDERFLEPYIKAVPAVPEYFRELRHLTRDNASQQRRLDRLEDLVEEKMRFTAHTIAMHRRGQGGVQLVATGEGKQTMDAIRAAAREIEDDEEHLLEQRSAAASRGAWRTTVLMVVGNGAAFAGVSLAVLLLMRELARRRRRELEHIQEQAQRELSLAAAFETGRLPRTLEELPVAIAIVALPGGELTSTNERFRTLFAADDVEVARVQDLVDVGVVRPDGTPLEMADLTGGGDVSDGTHAVSLRLARVGPTGARSPLVVHASPLVQRDSDMRALVVSFEDHSATAGAAEERESGERFRQLFLGLVGHDMRNPLSVISTATSTLLRRHLPPVEEALVERMRRSAERLSTMVDQMIALVEARLTSGVQIEPAPADLGDIARDVVNQIGVEEPAREVALELGGDLAGDWDEPRVRGVLMELVRNALRHTDEEEAVVVRGRGVDGSVEVDVEGGPPIPEHVRRFLFDPFRRADAHVRLRSAGFGIGLYLAQQVALAHGGSITPSTTADGRTMMELQLPREARS